jgi:hypothetical protein
MWINNDNLTGGLEKSSIYSRSLEGGAGTFFRNNTKFFIMANVNNAIILEQIDRMRTALLLGNHPVHNDVHITLLQFNINQNHPDSFIFFDPDFHQHIRTFYDKTISDKNLILNHKPNIFDLLGLTHKKFFAKLYYPDQPLVITDFRTLFYKYIGKRLGRYKIKERVFSGETYFIFNVRGKDLISIPGFYFGKAVWTPHVSVVNIKDIDVYNRELYEVYTYARDNEEKINILRKVMSRSDVGDTENIKMSQHINFLRLSLRNPEKDIHVDSVV